MECIMAVHGRFLMQKEPSLETSSLVVDAHENIILAILDHNAGLAHKLFKEHLIEVRKRLEQEPEKL
jgi:DNA-binding GntR family transcriptional regulator